MERWEKKDQDLYMKAGDNHMKINIGNHEFTELWDGVLYKALSDYPNVSDNEMKDIIDFVNYEKINGRQCEIEADSEDILRYVYMIIIPSEYRKQITEVMPEQLSDRAFLLSHDKLDVWQWSEKVYFFVHDMAKSNVN